MHLVYVWRVGDLVSNHPNRKTHTTCKSLLTAMFLNLSAPWSDPRHTPANSGRSTPCLLDKFPSSSGCSTPATARSILFEADHDNDKIDSTSDVESVLILGGLGFIGSHTAWEVLKDGQNVVIIDNLGSSFVTVLERLRTLVDLHFEGRQEKPLIEFHAVDYRNQDAMRSILEHSNIRGVIHFAAYKAVEESIKSPLKYYDNNVAGLIGFCSLLDELDIKTLIFSSSATVYGELANQGGHLREEMCVHQTTTWIDNDGQERTTMSGSTGLTNPYGRTKWMGEAILHDLASSDPAWKIIALRYFNPVGADSSGLLGEDPRGTPSNLMPVLVQTVTGERDVLKVFGSDWETRDGTCVRDFIHVTDLARGHVSALRKATGVIIGRIPRHQSGHRLRLHCC